ncbi:MAG: hypothetical protein QXF20_02045 [Candidatus Hadarchaeales archaeon]
MKVGGSLQEREEALKKVCSLLRLLSEDYDLVVVPGGGRMVETVRGLQRDLGFSEEVAHWMAILGMEAYGILLRELLRWRCVTSLKEVKGGTVFLPFLELRKEKKLERSWRLTSDSIAAWVCGKVECHTLVLVKGIEGIREGGRLRRVLTTKELREMGTNVVDPLLPDLLEKNRITCWVVGVKGMEGLEEALRGGETLGTKIVPVVE